MLLATVVWLQLLVSPTAGLKNLLLLTDQSPCAVNIQYTPGRVS